MSHSTTPYDRLMSLFKAEIDQIVLTTLEKRAEELPTTIKMLVRMSNSVSAKQLASKPHYVSKKLESFELTLRCAFYASIKEMLRKRDDLVEEFLSFDTIEALISTKAFNAWGDKTIELALFNRLDTYYRSVVTELRHLLRERTLKQNQEPMSELSKANCYETFCAGKAVLHLFGVTKLTLNRTFVSNPKWNELTVQHSQVQKTEYTHLHKQCDLKLLSALNPVSRKENSWYAFLNAKPSLKPYINEEVSEFMTDMSTEPVDGKISANPEDDYQEMELIQQDVVVYHKGLRG